jgi:hypothetical protein
MLSEILYAFFTDNPYFFPPNALTTTLSPQYSAAKLKSFSEPFSMGLSIQLFMERLMRLLAAMYFPATRDRP